MDIERLEQLIDTAADAYARWEATSNLHDHRDYDTAKKAAVRLVGAEIGQRARELQPG